ncbi:o-succinylbenzoate synthase [Erwinia tracheiphila]|uniref:o-succinylbenzoate synthase n=1 Tax=Erwinia tracheiphila TaxID=65700 RepID=A0A0M2KEG8_9GAMM|nr:o-succinylbenzoate synthase [Erwinia tracheiphila]AXF78785.1 o-succinylbenzoate synthase [Erwinia tracheiphila]KKF37770.1 O-succinylbenzoate synthase [Erwinia tracheiphila]UIA85633.1 o-succinylbenzoate synthase [Erwinia tracheiphila]UIA90150.1 o-succinylbenzoate synthase [Erwinia tracheiphila]UIA94165.1 o-succinylbenzoate synthase [Erwinia tracheiphila]
MRGATLFAYCIPLAAGTVLRDRRVKTRAGLLVRLTESGRQGWGEIAPLPGFSVESLSEAQAKATIWLQRWCSGEVMDAESTLPSVAFGLSCALAELHDTLPHEARYQGAVLCSGDPEDLFEQLHCQCNPVAKMKVGMYEPVRDAMVANVLLEALPTLTLRLDANRQWTPEKARKFAGFLTEESKSRIAWVEEPCCTPQESREFAQESGLALAWDESGREAGYQPVAESHLAALVIKPSLTGSLAAVAAWTARAKQAGLQVVISSSLESSLGLTQLARVAAWLTPHTLPGLDTLDLMSHQLVRIWPGCSQPSIAASELEVIWSH